MAFLKSSNRKENVTTLFGDRILLRAPKMSDYEQWVDLRQASEHFLRPYEPSWSVEDLTRRSFRKRIEFYKSGKRDGSAYAYFLRSPQDDRMLGGITLFQCQIWRDQLGFTWLLDWSTICPQWPYE